MVKKIVVAGSVASLLAGCSLFGEIAPAGEQGYFEPKSAATQDPYWQRFYELEQEIAQLKAKMGEPQLAAQTDPVVSPMLALEPTTPAGEAANDFLVRLQKKADKAVQAIDRAIASIGQLPSGSSAVEGESTVAVDDDNEVPGDYAVAQVSPQVAVAGSVERNVEGKVVTQVTYTQSRQPRYKYSLVYVYPEPQPWNEMWDKLEAANEQDKWRGSNPDKPTYFIYVGAYLRESDAQKRQDTLVAILGEGPQMRTNVQSVALAAK